MRELDQEQQNKSKKVENNKEMHRLNINKIDKIKTSWDWQILLRTKRKGTSKQY